MRPRAVLRAAAGLRAPLLTGGFTMVGRAGPAESLLVMARVFLPVDFFDEDFFAAFCAAAFTAFFTALLAGFLAVFLDVFFADFFAEDFLVEDFLAEDFLAEDFLVEDFLAALFLAALFLTARFLAPRFLPACFFAARFLLAFAMTSSASRRTMPVVSLTGRFAQSRIRRQRERDHRQDFSQGNCEFPAV